jgi:hypothetical protein
MVARMQAIIAQYHEMVATATDWGAKEGLYNAHQRQQLIDYLHEQYTSLYAEYRHLYQEHIELRERVRVLEALVQSEIFWKVRSQK